MSSFEADGRKLIKKIAFDHKQVRFQLLEPTDHRIMPVTLGTFRYLFDVRKQTGVNKPSNTRFVDWFRLARARLHQISAGCCQVQLHSVSRLGIHTLPINVSVSPVLGEAIYKITKSNAFVLWDLYCCMQQGNWHRIGSTTGTLLSNARQSAAKTYILFMQLVKVKLGKTRVGIP